MPKEMVEIKECIQAYNSKGEIVYRFRNIEELNEYNDKYWDMNPECYIKLKSANVRFARANDLLFYKEDQVIKTNHALIDSIIEDCTYLLGNIKFTSTDKSNINRYGSQYTMDILKQILDIVQPEVVINNTANGKSIVTRDLINMKEVNNSAIFQPDWEKQAFAMGSKPFFTTPVDNRSMLDKLKEQTLKLRMEKEKRQDALGGQDGGNYDDKGNSAHYQKQFMEFVRAQERLYGTIVAHLVCIANVDKYNQRAGVKEGVPASKDLTKRDWYQKAARHFKLKIEAHQNGFIATNRNAYVPMAEEVKDLICLEHPFSELFNVGYVPLSVAIEK